MQDQSRMMLPNRSTTGRAGGFTLVELLVVISIIGLLLGILLPSLGAAREAAHSVVCQTNLRSIVQAQVAYYTDNKGDLAGSPGTTARDLLNDQRASSGNALEVFGDATQPFDWAGPFSFGGYLGGDYPTPKFRNERFALLNGSGGLRDPEAGGSGPFAMLYCPSQRLLSAPYFGQNVGTRLVGTEEFPVTVAFSYTSSRDMLWIGGSGKPRWGTDTFWGTKAGTLYYPGWADVQLPGGSGYSPKISRLDQPSAKVFITDGTRFQAANNYVVDHDTAANAGYGGAFADPGPYQTNDVTRAFPAGQNLSGQDMSSISYRHGGGGQAERGTGGAKKGNAGFFDGHVETLDLNEARRPDYWLPSGTLVNINTITKQLRPEYSKRLESARGRFVRIN